MTFTKNCMSIDAIVDNSNNNTTSTLPLSPPDSYKSRSPTLSPKSVYMVPPIIPGSPSPPPQQYHDRTYQMQHDEEEDYHHHHHHQQQQHHHHNSMSPEERRYRNKLASAKYRAKKQASMKFMTSKLSELMSTNSSLEQELAKVKQENLMLKAMYEKMANENKPHQAQYA